MNIEERQKRLEELYAEIDEINKEILKEKTKDIEKYLNKYFKIDDEDESTFGNIISYDELGILTTFELVYDYYKHEHSLGLGNRNPQEMEFISEEEFLKKKKEFIKYIEEDF